jgi:hypothetical protein
MVMEKPEIRDITLTLFLRVKAVSRTTEGQHYRIAGLNLLTAIIHLGHAVTQRRDEGLDLPPELLAHISPLGWAHILLTGEYLWPKGVNA